MKLQSCVEAQILAAVVRHLRRMNAAERISYYIAGKRHHPVILMKHLFPLCVAVRDRTTI